MKIRIHLTRMRGLAAIQAEADSATVMRLIQEETAWEAAPGIVPAATVPYRESL